MNRFLWLFGLAIVLFASCKKYGTPGYLEGERASVDSSKVFARKVLLVQMDGLPGKELERYLTANKGKLANLEKLMAVGKYSFKTLAGAANGEATAWSTQFSGYDFSSHQIKDLSFKSSTDQSRRGFAKNTGVPGLFARLNALNTDLISYSFMQSKELSSVISQGATERFISTNDVDLMKSAVDIISKRAVDFCLVELTDPIKAGKNGGFVLENSKYTDALQKADAHIGKLLDAIQQRTNAKQEDWMIIVTSSFGGTATGITANGENASLETFALYSNPRLSEKKFEDDKFSYFHAYGYYPMVVKHSENNTNPRGFDEMGYRAQSPADEGSKPFNFSTTGELLIEFRMRTYQDNYWADLAGSGGYTFYSNQFIGKDSSAIAPNTPGWSIIGWNNEFSLRLDDGSYNSKANISRGTDGIWNHYAISIKNYTANSVVIRWYINGVQREYFTMANFTVESISNNYPFTLGFNEQDEFYAITSADYGNVRVWNSSLTNEDVARLACQTTIPPSDPNYANLIASYDQIFFPGNKKIWKNSIAGKAADLTISGSEPIKDFERLGSSCKITVPFRTVDLLPQVFYWLGYTVPTEWRLDGRLFLNQFENEITR